MSFSIIIICQDEEKHIGPCIESILGLSDDIILIDSGSSDRTIQIINEYPVTLINWDWLGYGQTKNYGATMAKYDWILSIDADEIVHPKLYESLKNWNVSSDHVYTVMRINYIGDRAMKYGHLKPEIKPRLFNKIEYGWDQKPVHEELTPSISNKKTRLLQGQLLHQQADDLDELEQKYWTYARLSDTAYSPLNFFAPYYHFFKSYILQLGCLEGQIGWQLALLAYRYRYNKNLS